ncbi:MAG: type I-C CRISPR-associated protein Cas8c/Csd1, partial [Armatimonadota bacterium]
EMFAPYVVGRTSGIEPALLVDVPAYVLGVMDPKRGQEKHRKFVELVEECAEKTQLASVQAVLSFLRSHQYPDPPADMGEGDLVTFRVDGDLPIDHPDVRSFWEARTAGSEYVKQCLICGRTVPVEKNLPVKIKGIPGGQPSGTQIVSANDPAYESYGLERSVTSPICRGCGERFGKALNALISDEERHLRVGSLIYVFWSVDAPMFSPVSWLSMPDPGLVKKLITSYATAQQVELGDEAPFYATALSASGGRAIVRDWLETTIGSVKASLARWFELQSIVNWDGSEGPYLGIWALAVSLYRKTDDIPTWVPRELVMAALHGHLLANAVMSIAVRRVQATGKVTHPQAALLKAVLAQHMRSEEANRMTELDATNKTPAYLCGRLMAVLEAVQRQAVPGIKSTVMDRFFGTASSAPASVFGTLLRSAQAHLGKLRKTNEAAYHALQVRIESILADLDQFPTALTLTEQALFCLGYYHQRAADHKAARERSQAHSVNQEEDLRNE